MSGQLKTTQKLDRESIDQHSFTVRVVDGGNPPLSAEASLRIHVDDINDHAPEFEKSSYTRYFVFKTLDTGVLGWFVSFSETFDFVSRQVSL